MSKGERHIRKVQPSLSVHLTIDDSTHKTTNRISPISNIYNPRLGSTHTLLMFSRSKEKRNTNKRCTTEPEGEELLASSNKKN